MIRVIVAQAKSTKNVIIQIKVIKFVYFDVGGVTILDLTGTNKWHEFEQEIGIPAEDSKRFEKFWDEHEPELCTGRDTESLIPLIEKEFGVNIPSDYSLLIDGLVKKFGTNKSIWPLINIFHKLCPIGLLTNMYPGMLTEIKKHNLLPDISWDIIIDSSVVKLQKPDSKIFALAEQKAGFSGKEILFVDNTLKNIKAAKKFGWQTCFYDSSNLKKSNQELVQSFNKFRDNQ